MSTVVVVSAGLSNPSSTRLLADRLSAGTVAALEGVEVVNVELRDLAHDLTDHLLTGFPSPRLAHALAQVREADGVIAVTPVFNASYSGLFKTFFDVLDPGALDATPVLVAATAGSVRHSLVIDHALRPLFSYLRAVIVPTGVFAATADFGSAGTDLDERITRATAELAALVGTLAGGVSGPNASRTRRRTVEDELAEPTPFEELLARAGRA